MCSCGPACCALAIKLLQTAAQQSITTAHAQRSPTGYVLQRPRQSSFVCQAGANGKHNAPERRVVVTGMGVVSSLGHEVEEFYDKLLQVLGAPVIMAAAAQPCAYKCCVAVSFMHWSCKQVPCEHAVTGKIRTRVISWICRASVGWCPYKVSTLRTSQHASLGRSRALPAMAM